MPKMIVNPGQSFLIHGRQMVAGDEFECSDKEAVIWQGKGWAMSKRGPGRPRKDELPAPRYSRMDLRPVEDE